MLFAFIMVLFAGLAFMFLCLLRGQEKLAATLREELAATRSRLEALERRLASRAERDQPAAPEPFSPDPFGPEPFSADAPLELPADSVIRAPGVDLPAPEPQFSFDAGGETTAWPSDGRADARAEGQTDRFSQTDRLSMDRLDMRPPSPGRDAGRARAAGMPELKL